MTSHEEHHIPGSPERTSRLLVGVDCYPLDDERHSFSAWYDRDVDAEFAEMAAAEIALVRIFISWKAFEQQVGQYDDDAEARLEGLIASASAHGLKLLVCFFADDRLAEMNDVSWGQKRDVRIDDYLVQRQISLVQRIVTQYRNEQTIWGWDLGNEAFFAGFKREEPLERWVWSMRDAIREIDSERPILVGADTETLFRETGVDARTAADTAEYATAHVTAAYRAYAAEGPITLGPATYLDSYLTRCAAHDLPVLLDGVGVHSLDFSPAEETAFVRSVLYQALMNGAAGVMLRRWRDAATDRREPYFRDPFEVLVGVMDADGAPKPVLADVRRFARVAARLDPRTFTPAPERAAVLIPAERMEPLPSLAGLYAPRSCLQAYIAAKEAHLPVAVIREGQPLGAFSVVFVPSAAKLGAAMWRELGSFVQSGGSVVCSYGGGDADPAVREIFGVEFLGDAGVRSQVSCRVAQAGLLGNLASFDVALEVPHYATLGHDAATVVATDAKGSPLLTRNQYGQGVAVFVAASLERAIAQSDPWAAPEPVRALLREVYGAVARSAGAGPVIDCDHPDVEIAAFLGEDGDVVVALNHTPEPVTATVRSERVVASVADARGGPATGVGARAFGVPLSANGATALRVTYE